MYCTVLRSVVQYSTLTLTVTVNCTYTLTLAISYRMQSEDEEKRHTKFSRIALLHCKKKK